MNNPTSAMITEIIKLLQMEEHKGISKDVEIAKGRHYLPTTWRGAVKAIKRMTWRTKL